MAKEDNLKEDKQNSNSTVISEKENRIRKIAFLYYSRPDIRKSMVEFAQNREVVPRYFEGFGKRPDTVQFESDILELAKMGSTSFHCSEEIWRDPLELSTNLTQEQLNEMRQGWDLLIDIDSKYLDYSKIAAELIIKALEYNQVKNVCVKFSGSKGFHILVPWKAFPKIINGKETRKLFPELPRAICVYLNDMIKDELIERITGMMLKDRKEYVKDFEAPKQVMPDIVLVSSRHLFRMPYSLHEKTSLASAVLDRTKISEFQPKDADPLKISSPKTFIPEVKEEEATELLIQALDHASKEISKMQKTQEQKKSADNFKEFDEIVFKDLTPEFYPPSIKFILNGMKSDGRKRALFILLNFFRSLKFNNDKIEKIIEEWNQKNYRPLEQNYIKSQISWHTKAKSRLPPNFDKPHYKEIGITLTNEELSSKNPVSYVTKKIFYLNKKKFK